MSDTPPAASTAEAVRHRKGPRPLPRRVTPAWLRSVGVCEYWIARFRERYGDGIEPSYEAVMDAAASGFNPGVLAEAFLGPETFAAFLAEYSAVYRRAAAEA